MPTAKNAVKTISLFRKQNFKIDPCSRPRLSNQFNPVLRPKIGRQFGQTESDQWVGPYICLMLPIVFDWDCNCLWNRIYSQIQTTNGFELFFIFISTTFDEWIQNFEMFHFSSLRIKSNLDSGIHGPPIGFAGLSPVQSEILQLTRVTLTHLRQTKLNFLHFKKFTFPVINQSDAETKEVLSNF